MAIILTAIGLATSLSANAQAEYQFQILHAFTYPSITDGNGPAGRLVFDHKGNLYGTTLGGGTANECPGGCGTVFELTPGANGAWTETILHNFSRGSTDGFEPAGVVIDKDGNLYGQTTAGGLNNRGTVFELTPRGNGEWTESIVYNFCSLVRCADGGSPESAPTPNATGGLYGVTGGSPGTAYQLTPGANGWTFTLLYTFCSQPDCADGSDPDGSLILDKKGNLYGETSGGGITNGECGGHGCDLAFALQQQTGGGWKEVVLHEFGSGNDGYFPGGGVTLHGNALYGSTEGGGGMGCLNTGCGTVFELTRGSGKTINEQILHDFGANGAQGTSPLGGVTFDPRGNLFGITGGGGSPSCECGIVYGMQPETSGKFQVLHSFIGSDGGDPEYGLTIDSKGNLYGTTLSGGPNNGGVVFELSPTPQAAK